MKKIYIVEKYRISKAQPSIAVYTADCFKSVKDKEKEINKISPSGWRCSQVKNTVIYDNIYAQLSGNANEVYRVKISEVEPIEL